MQTFALNFYIFRVSSWKNNKKTLTILHIKLNRTHIILSLRSTKGDHLSSVPFLNSRNKEIYESGYGHKPDKSAESLQTFASPQLDLKEKTTDTYIIK